MTKVEWDRMYDIITTYQKTYNMSVTILPNNKISIRGVIIKKPHRYPFSVVLDTVDDIKIYLDSTMNTFDKLT